MAAKLKKVGTDKTREEALVNLRSTLEWLGEDVHTIENEVDPIVEMCTITKAFDNSKVLLANNIKGFPGVRMISNIVDCEIPDGLAVDMRLEASFDDIDGEWTLVKFRPA